MDVATSQWPVCGTQHSHDMEDKMSRSRLTMICCLLLFAIAPVTAWSSATDAVFAITVEPFLAALQQGDIEGARQYTAGGLYRNITEAAEQNVDYGAFLRQRYDGATFSPIVLEAQENNMIVGVEVDFAGKGTSVFDLLIARDSTGSWRIVDQYSPTDK